MIPAKVITRNSFAWVLGLMLALTLAACAPPTIITDAALETAVPTPEPEPVPRWTVDRYRSDCLGRTIEIPENAPVIDLDYSQTPIDTQLADANMVVLGTIAQVSHTCFNQDGGAFYRTGLPYFEILLTVDEVLQQNLGLEAGELVLTQVGYSPLDDSVTPPFAVGNVVVALIVDREMGWVGGNRAILRPYDHFSSSLLVQQPDGTYASGDGQTALTLEEIRAQLATEPVLGCAKGGIGVFTPEDVRCYLATFDPAFVWQLDEATAVLFTTPNAMADWIGGAIIYHIPTASSLVFDFNGEIDPQFTVINGPDAQSAFDRLQAESDIMTRIQQRVQTIWQTEEGTRPESLMPGLVYAGSRQGCGSIFVYQANDDAALSEFLTVFLPAPQFALSEEPVTLEIADYLDQITVKIDLFGGRVYDFGEFPYCNDVGPEAKPQAVWLATAGRLTVSVSGPVPEGTCTGDGFETTIRLVDLVFSNGETTVQLDEALFEDVYVGWCVG